MKKPLSLILAIGCLATATLQIAAQGSHKQVNDKHWINLSDEAFAAQYADMAFKGTLKDRQKLAWMFFARVNQLIDDNPNPGMSNSGKVPAWMAWPTDPDTFSTLKRFEFHPNRSPRRTMKPSAKKKDIEVGKIGLSGPNRSNEEITRNRLSYEYLVDNGLTTKLDLAAFFAKNQIVNMPIGSVELKASWMHVTKNRPAPEGALTFTFESGEYWWRGLHIMVKMRSLADPTDAFYSEDPSWFWTTFEFNNNPGVENVRETLITQRSPLAPQEIKTILTQAGLGNFGLEAYAPNGTQIRFTEHGTGKTHVILGHTDMEDFAGSPNVAQPAYWTEFQSSCHSCHATAAYNPESGDFFPFSVATGALKPGYSAKDKEGHLQYLGEGYKPLDFMWPIVFHAR